MVVTYSPFLFAVFAMSAPTPSLLLIYSTSSLSDRELTVKFDGEGESYAQNEIMFILDTTGSMGDEMLFLQSEFTAITNQIGTENTKYSVNFYRDTKDDYVTKCFDFTDDVAPVEA